MRIRFDEIPGFQAAIKRENDVRDAAFLDIPFRVSDRIEIRQMTPRDLLILDGIGNPLLSGGFPTGGELAEFLWLLNPNHSKSQFKRFMFARRVRKINYLTAVKACLAYTAETFQDSPSSSGSPSIPYAGLCAHIVNKLAIEYGWKEQEILNIPLKRLFQYLKCIRRYHNPSAVMHNPSDKVKGAFIRLKTARLGLLELLRKRAANQ